MANEFVIKNGYISKGDSIVEGSLTATTISASTYTNLPTDIYVTGGTFSSGTTTFNTSIGTSFSVSGYTPVPATDVSYNNSVSLLTGTTIQSALDQNTSVTETFYTYRSGTTQHFQGPSRSWTNTTAFANVIIGIPLVIKKDVTVTNLKWFINTGAVGSSVFGLYSTENNSPTTLLWQTSVFNTNTTGLLTYTFPTPIIIKKGFYLLAHHVESQISVKCTGAFQGYFDFLGIASALNFTDNFIYSWRGNVSWSTYNGVLPNTWPSSVQQSFGTVALTLVGFTVQ